MSGGGSVDHFLDAVMDGLLLRVERRRGGEHARVLDHPDAHVARGAKLLCGSPKAVTLERVVPLGRPQRGTVVPILRARDATTASWTRGYVWNL